VHDVLIAGAIFAAVFFALVIFALALAFAYVALKCLHERLTDPNHDDNHFYD